MKGCDYSSSVKICNRFTLGEALRSVRPLGPKEGYRPHRIHHGHGFATSRQPHINGIENCWGYAKTTLKRYYGIPRNQFLLHLKEMEFRINHRDEDLHAPIRRILKKS